ncbi:uncharacterized protein SCODWIG_03184 [Saccharomycodes ludwigii]|uniref:Uncharacterized protein n=1 Tax=Saccharomycodes ludwigii TaxID=36035 RepID=A0A376B9R2_9ASCO|nr:uncharacterized protein SCODWIG_03184 [Saccharomycodes ludwigii]
MQTPTPTTTTLTSDTSFEFFSDANDNKNDSISRKFIAMEINYDDEEDDDDDSMKDSDCEYENEKENIIPRIKSVDSDLIITGTSNNNTTTVLSTKVGSNNSIKRRSTSSVGERKISMKNITNIVHNEQLSGNTNENNHSNNGLVINSPIFIKDVEEQVKEEVEYEESGSTTITSGVTTTNNGTSSTIVTNSITVTPTRNAHVSTISTGAHNSSSKKRWSTLSFRSENSFSSSSKKRYSSGTITTLGTSINNSTSTSNGTANTNASSNNNKRDSYTSGENANINKHSTNTPSSTKSKRFSTSSLQSLKKTSSTASSLKTFFSISSPSVEEQKVVPEVVITSDHHNISGGTASSNGFTATLVKNKKIVGNVDGINSKRINVTGKMKNAATINITGNNNGNTSVTNNAIKTNIRGIATKKSSIFRNTASNKKLGAENLSIDRENTTSYNTNRRLNQSPSLSSLGSIASGRSWKFWKRRSSVSNLYEAAHSDGNLNFQNDAAVSTTNDGANVFFVPATTIGNNTNPDNTLRHQHSQSMSNIPPSAKHKKSFSELKKQLFFNSGNNNNNNNATVAISNSNDNDCSTLVSSSSSTNTATNNSLKNRASSTSLRNRSSQASLRNRSSQASLRNRSSQASLRNRNSQTSLGLRNRTSNPSLKKLTSQINLNSGGNSNITPPNTPLSNSSTYSFNFGNSSNSNISLPIPDKASLEKIRMKLGSSTTNATASYNNSSISNGSDNTSMINNTSESIKLSVSTSTLNSTITSVSSSNNSFIVAMNNNNMAISEKAYQELQQLVDEKSYKLPKDVLDGDILYERGNTRVLFNPVKNKIYKLVAFDCTDHIMLPVIVNDIKISHKLMNETGSSIISKKWLIITKRRVTSTTNCTADQLDRTNLLDNDERDGHSCLLIIEMESRGKPLSQVLIEKPNVPSRTLSKIFWQLVNVLASWEVKYQFEHRDLNLDNILVDSNGKVTVIDYKLCKMGGDTQIYTRLDHPLFFIRSPHYDVYSELRQLEPYMLQNNTSNGAVTELIGWANVVWIKYILQQMVKSCKIRDKHYDVLCKWYAMILNHQGEILSCQDLKTHGK